jgi:hypothetical protein
MLQAHPHLSLRVTMGALSVEIIHGALVNLSKWLVAAQAHAHRGAGDHPVLLRCYASGYWEIGVDGIVGETTWIECRPLYVQGGTPTVFTLHVPGHVDGAGVPVAARIIRL